MKKLTTYLGLALAVLIIGGAGLAYAQYGAGAGGGEDLANKLVEKFGLDQSEVDQVVAEFRQERKAQKQTRGQERLEQMVENGDITAEQKEMIEQKREGHRAEMENLSLEERRDQRDEHRAEMREYMEENGIDCQGSGEGMHRGWQNK
jgi:hypothetical protein